MSLLKFYDNCNLILLFLNIPLYQDLREAITVSRFEQALQGSPAFQALEIVCGQLCYGGSVTAGLDGLHDPTLGEMLKRKVDLSLRLTHSPHFNEMPCGGVDNIIGNVLGMKIGNEQYQSLANGLEDMMRNCLQVSWNLCVCV